MNIEIGKIYCNEDGNKIQIIDIYNDKFFGKPVGFSYGCRYNNEGIADPIQPSKLIEEVA